MVMPISNGYLLFPGRSRVACEMISATGQVTKKKKRRSASQKRAAQQEFVSKLAQPSPSHRMRRVRTGKVAAGNDDTRPRPANESAATTHVCGLSMSGRRTRSRSPMRPRSRSPMRPVAPPATITRPSRRSAPSTKPAFGTIYAERGNAWETPGAYDVGRAPPPRRTWARSSAESERGSQTLDVPHMKASRRSSMQGKTKCHNLDSSHTGFMDRHAVQTFDVPGPGAYTPSRTSEGRGLASQWARSVSGFQVSSSSGNFAAAPRF